jgi:sentrin-specific protease 1
LNDEVINFYGALVQRRADEALQVVGGKATNKKLRDIHFFNSFFYAKLQQGYEKSRLARWTKKVTGDCTTPFLRRAHFVTTQSQINIFEKDIIIFPINVGNMHWVCGAINFKDKRIEYYDSLASEPDEAVFEVNTLFLVWPQTSVDLVLGRL